jgi:hypothetical protein
MVCRAMRHTIQPCKTSVRSCAIYATVANTVLGVQTDRAGMLQGCVNPVRGTPSLRAQLPFSRLWPPFFQYRCCTVTLL